MSTLGYRHFDVTIGGKTLIMHNGQTADPLNRYAKAMKVLSGKRGKTDADLAELARIEYEAGLYLNAKQQVVIPSTVLEAVVCAGARKTKEGKLALSGLFVDTDLVLAYDGGPLSVKKLLASEDHTLRVAVRVSQSKVMRTRPMFHDWKGTFTCSVSTEVANEAQLTQWVENAGSFVGLCDWRPRHGRFGLVSIKATARRDLAA